MNTREALYEIGVRDDTLTAAEKSFLDENGYLVLHNVVSPAQLEQLRGRVDELGRIEGAEAGKEVHQEAGTDRLADLVNKGEAFTVCYTHPRVLAAIHHVLRDEMKLSSLNSRSALPGEGLQELHADWESPVKPGEFLVCNSIWLLDDFTHDNGATRVVPGSHVSGKLPRDEMSDPAAPHPREVQIIAPAGSVGVFNAHTWHG